MRGYMTLNEVPRPAMLSNKVTPNTPIMASQAEAGSSRNGVAFVKDWEEGMRDGTR